MRNLYIVDTSSLIDLQENYPRATFLTVWDNFENLIHSQQIISPIEVFNEISSTNTFLHNWCKNNKKIFKNNNVEILNFVAEIMNTSPNLVDPDKFGPAADPFIIALARSKKSNIDGAIPVILTQEINRVNKIPSVAENYNIRSINLLELFIEERWTF